MHDLMKEKIYARQYAYNYVDLLYKQGYFVTGVLSAASAGNSTIVYA